MTTNEGMSLDENLMPERLEAFFRRRFPDAGTVAVSEYAPLLGGYSRLTSEFVVEIDGESKRYVLRGDPPAGSSAAETDRTKEWDLLSALTEQSEVATPPARYFDADGSELGTLAILLDRIDGAGLSASWSRVSPGEEGEIAMKMCDLMVDIHSVDLDILPASLARSTDWNSYIDQRIAMIRTLESEYVEPNPFYRYLAQWLDINRPPPVPLTLVHGELQSSNVLLDRDKNLLAIDWEHSHIGDPREDIGWCMLIEAFHPPYLVNVDEEAFYARYRERTGLSEEVLNKKTVAYFMIQTGLVVLGIVGKQIGSFALGSNTDIKTGFLVASIARAHQEWLSAVKMIEAA